MKVLFELFPILLFFIAFKFKGIFFATAVAIVASLLQIGVAYFRSKKVEPMMWISLVVILVFGSATLIFRNEVFIKWKPTILYWIFSGTIFTIKFVYKKNAMQGLLEKQLQLPLEAWERLNMSWGAFFAALGAVNLFVAYKFSTAAWVNFKLFGIMGILILFVIAQSLFIAPYLPKEEKNLDNK